MIKANLRLVVKIAHDYVNLGLPMLTIRPNLARSSRMKVLKRRSSSSETKTCAMC